MTSCWQLWERPQSTRGQSAPNQAPGWRVHVPRGVAVADTPRVAPRVPSVALRASRALCGPASAVADVLDEDRILLPAEKLTALPGACHRLVSDPMPSRLWLLADSGAQLLQDEPPVQAGS